MNRDLYEILQVSRKAEQEVIEAAYKRLSRKYHPDVNKNSDADEKMKKINNAYRILSDPIKRASYDELDQNSEDFKSEKHQQTDKDETEFKSKNNFNKRNYKLWLILLIPLVFFLIYRSTINNEASSTNLLSQEPVTVTKVISGNVIEINGGEKIRYLGVDSPDARSNQCFGDETFKEVKSLIEGKQIVLQEDRTKNDQDGLPLRYAYFKLENGQYLFINDYLIRVGYAKFDKYPSDNKFMKEFKEAEEEAKTNKKGLWGYCRS